MRIYTLLRRGELHPTFCEDFLIQESIGSNYFIAAVMDGCSSGTESHFASALFGKCLRKITKTLVYERFFDQAPSVEETAYRVLKNLFEELVIIRNQLLLDQLEMLSTLNLLVYDKVQDQAFMGLWGDGFIAIDGEIHEIDQNNRPDYPAYHLGENFEEWYVKSPTIFLQKNPKDLSIATDGVDTFKTYRSDLPEGLEPMRFLLKDTQFAHQANMLNRKCIILEKKYNYLPGDDIAVVRIRFTPNDSQ